MKLNDYLKDSGIKQTYFAKKIGITRAALSRILRQNVTPKLSTMISIEKATSGQVSLADWVEKTHHIDRTNTIGCGDEKTE